MAIGDPWPWLARESEIPFYQQWPIPTIETMSGVVTPEQIVRAAWHRLSNSPLVYKEDTPDYKNRLQLRKRLKRKYGA